jgi:glyoxylase-like metal-dependent hydrolase (beta-lactamase superfamily II)
MQGKRVTERAVELTGKPVVMVINTHHHRDHSHGNPGVPGELRIVATENARRHMLEVDAKFWKSAPTSLPNELVTHEQRLEIGGKTIELLSPGRGHTDGDLVVLFVEDAVVHTGDLVFNDRYPNIDLEAGGSIERWPAAIDRLSELDFKHVIPGHGPLTNRAGIARFRAFIDELWAAGADAAAKGWSLDETLERVILTRNARMEDIVIPFVLRLDRNFVIKRVWQEATGAVPTGGAE